MVHFNPLCYAHFDPLWVAHFNPPQVAYYVRFLHSTSQNMNYTETYYVVDFITLTYKYSIEMTFEHKEQLFISKLNELHTILNNNHLYMTKYHHYSHNIIRNYLQIMLILSSKLYSFTYNFYCN